MPLSATANLAQLIATSQPAARDVLSSVLGDCCTSSLICNDLFMEHCIETCYETREEQRDAVLGHLLNGVCVLRPGVSSCKSLGRHLASTMHLSYDICTLLLAAYKNKKLTLTTFRMCCASISLKADGSNHGRDLSHKLQQHLTRWGPLRDCEDVVGMFSRIESFGSGSLLELTSLHGIDYDVSTPNKDLLHDVIVRHFVFGECRNSNAALCASVHSALLPSAESDALMNLTPFILDAVINLGRKRTLRRVLDCVGIPYASTDPIRTLRSLLAQHHETSFVNGRLNLWRDRNLKTEESATMLSDVANAWPQRIPHVDKACIVHDFRTATSSDALKTVTCAACAEKVRATDASNQFVSDLDLNVLRSSQSIPSDQTNPAPPLPYTEGPLLVFWLIRPVFTIMEMVPLLFRCVFLAGTHCCGGSFRDLCLPT